MQHVGRALTVLGVVTCCWQLSDVVYRTQATVFHRDIQTPKEELQIQRAVEYFDEI